jgi:hypothetical protein
VKKQRKKVKRNKQKYPNLNPRVNHRVKQELIADIDYLNKLNDEEKEWLNKFLGEELSGNFKNDGTDFNTSKEDRKRIYDATNARNRCQFTLIKAKVANTHLLNYEDRLNMVEAHIHNELPEATPIEDVYIDYLSDKKTEQIEMIKEYRKFMRNFTEESG